MPNCLSHPSYETSLHEFYKKNFSVFKNFGYSMSKYKLATDDQLKYFGVKSVKSFQKEFTEFLKVAEIGYDEAGNYKSFGMSLKNEELDTKRGLLSGAKGRSKRGVLCNLGLHDIEIPDVCPVLGIKLARNVGGGKPSPGSPSLDKIDPTKGYVKGNTQVISQKANRMKSDASPEELRKFAEWVLKTYPA